MQKNPTETQINKLKKNLRTAHLKQKNFENQLLDSDEDVDLYELP